MSVENVKVRAGAVFASKVEDRITALEYGRADLMHKAGRQGLASSSYVVNSLYELASTEIEILTRIAWQDLHRVHQLIGDAPIEGLGRELKAALRSLVDPVVPRVKTEYEKGMKTQTGPPKDLEQAIDRAYEKVDCEIDLYEDALLAAREKAADGTGQQIFYNYAPVGAIVTGGNDVSIKIAQQNVTEHRETLIAALEKLLAEIESKGQAVAPPEIADLVETTIETVRREDANPLTIRGLLLQIGGVVGTLAALKPAYETLRAAAALVGVQLP